MTTQKSIGEENYDQFADRYAEYAKTKADNADYNFPAVTSLIENVVGARVLDAGCGYGIFTEWLLERQAEVVAFDVTRRMVEMTQAAVGDRATVFRHDLHDPLDFAEAESFDWVICPLVLDYIKDWQAVFTEFARVLKSGGKFVFSSGHPFGDYVWLKYRAQKEVNYREIEEFITHWGGFGEPKPRIQFFRRPLSQTLNPIIAAGLYIDYILEPLPTEAYREKDPEGYKKRRQMPSFICVRAVKP